MFRRLLYLAPLAPAAALIGFAAMSAAGAAAEGRAAAQEAAREALRAPNELRDVQVGERGRLMRVALICRRDCDVAARPGGSFFIPGLAAALEIDLKGRSRLAEALAFTAEEGGSALAVKSARPMARAAIRDCVIGGARASCIDIEFADAQAPGATQAEKRQADKKQASAAAIRSSKEETATAPTLKPAPAMQAAPERPPAQTAASSAPALRETPADGLLVFAGYAAPERLEPPASGAPGKSAEIPTLAALSAPAPTAVSEGPVLREDSAAVFAPREIDIARETERILGKRLGVAECEGAQARLREDAWALDAMVDVGFCKAAAGKLEEADGVFIRLLAYTPDNYEALVGRALIAAKSGERAVARKYFQDALNALPPIEESNRIVNAMAGL
ncbi:MAG: hypothetical protein Kow00133_03230 [Amphiplicatus sp.]